MRKILAIATFLITPLLLAATQPPVIYGPNSTVNLLSNGLSFFNKVYFLSGTADPTSVAQNAPAGSIYLRYGASTGLYIKADAGATTNWVISSVPAGLLPAANGGTGVVNAGLLTFNQSGHFSNDSQVTTFTGKSMSGATNTFTAIPLTTAVTGVLPGANGGTGTASSGTITNTGVVTMDASGHMSTDAQVTTFSGKSMNGTTNTFTALPLATAVTGILPAANGGTGTASSGIITNTGIVTINASGHISPDNQVTTFTGKTMSVSTNTFTGITAGSIAISDPSGNLAGTTLAPGTGISISPITTAGTPVTISATGGSSPIEYAVAGAICDTGSTCTLTSKSSGITGVGRGGTGLYTITFGGGVFSSAPSCVVSTAQNTGTVGAAVGLSANTTTAMSFECRTSTLDANANCTPKIICAGTR